MAENFNDDEEIMDGQSEEKVTTEFIPPKAGLNAENSDGQSENYYDYKKNRQRQQLAVAGLAVVGAGILILGFIQIKNIIQIPWPVSKNEQGQAIAKVDQKKTEVDLKNEDPQKLKKQDTDEDGLSDFDEVYIYETSAYLADSDSDGVNDIEEIKNNEDPMCPTGVKCFSTASGISETSEISEISETSKLSETNVTAEQLKQALIQSGKVTAEQLKGIDDQTILDFYNKMVKDNPDLAKPAEPKSATETIGENSVNAADAVAQLKNLSIDEIKKSLLDQGADPDLLKQIDDATLKKLYLEALDKASAGVK